MWIVESSPNAFIFTINPLLIPTSNGGISKLWNPSRRYLLCYIPAVTRYQNKSGNSGVLAYETGRSFIRIQFVEGSTYTYSYKSSGKAHVEQMKLLAAAGKGLSGYISRYVKDAYEK